MQSENVPTVVVVKDESRFVKNEAFQGDGGVFFASGDGVGLAIENNTLFKGNVAERRGGAIFVSSAAYLTITDAFFVENQSKRAGGGAIFAEADGLSVSPTAGTTLSSPDASGSRLDVAISSTLFARNRARGYFGTGGGIRLQGRGIRCSLRESVLFSHNVANLDGGGMYLLDQASSDIKSATFVGNEALNGGGAAIYVLVRHHVTPVPCSLPFARLSQSLQQARAHVLEVVVTQTAFLFNSGLYSNRGGGCIGVTGLGSKVTIRNCTFRGNNGGRGSGGAVYAFHGPVIEVEHSHFERNKAERGGALYGEVEKDARTVTLSSADVCFRMTPRLTSETRHLWRIRRTREGPFTRGATSTSPWSTVHSKETER